MPVHRRRIAALVTALVLATPVPAGAQSAGDDQYEDPFAGEEQGQSQGGGSEEETAPEPTAPAEEQAPAAAAEAAPSAAPASSAPQTQLPYTGVDATTVLLAGSILLAAGVALRVRVREQP